MDLVIRPVEPEDARGVHALVTRPEIADALGGLPTDPLDAWKKRLDEASPEGAYRAVAVAGGQVTGIVSLELSAHPRLRHAAKLWIAVAPERQRRGIGRALLTAALDAADRWLALARVELDVFAGNRGAIALYQTAGFQAEAVRRGGDFLRDGAPGDALRMARLRPGFDPGSPSPPPPIPPRGERVEHVVVRPVTPDDAPGMARISTAYQAMRGTLQLPSMSAAAWRKRLASNPPGQHHVFGALVEGELVGLAGLHGYGNPRLRHVAGLGMNVLETWQGRGIGGRLMRELLELGDRWLSLRRIELEVYIDNERAIRLYEHAGFTREGVQRAYAFRDGAYGDVLVMGRVR